jgi:hypothetical protein
MGCEAVWLGRLVVTFSKPLLPPYSDLKMEVTGPSETFVHIYQSPQRHISQDSNVKVTALGSHISNVILIFSW